MKYIFFQSLRKLTTVSQGADNLLNPLPEAANSCIDPRQGGVTPYKRNIQKKNQNEAKKEESHLWVPKLTTPARYHRPLRTAIKGPPESPEQESVADWPLAHSWLSSKVRELMPGPSLPLAAALLYSSWQAVLLIGCRPVNWRRGEEEALSVLPQPAMFMIMIVVLLMMLTIW